MVVAGILKCKPRVLPVERADFAAAMSPVASKEHPKCVIPKSKFFEKAAVFKCQDAPELCTLKFGQNVVPEY